MGQDVFKMTFEYAELNYLRIVIWDVLLVFSLSIPTRFHRCKISPQIYQISDLCMECDNFIFSTFIFFLKRIWIAILFLGTGLKMEQCSFY